MLSFLEYGKAVSNRINPLTKTSIEVNVCIPIRTIVAYDTNQMCLTVTSAIELFVLKVFYSRFCGQNSLLGG